MGGKSTSKGNLRKVRLDCGGKTVPEILKSLGRKLFSTLSKGESGRITLQLESVDRVEGSLSSLLFQLFEFLDDRKVEVSIIDPTGCAEVIYQAMGSCANVDVQRSDDKARSPLNVLVVEDNEDSLQFIRTLLESAGHGVSIARTGRGALRECDKTKYDLILMDLVLPDLDGLSVARLLGGSRPKLVAMSAYLDRYQDHEFLEAGFGTRIAKPFKNSDLLAAVSGN